MKNKLVIWSKNTDNEKVLVAIELLADTGKIKIHMFPEAIASAAFVNQMMDVWRDDKAEVPFPDGHVSIEKELSITESMLPEHLKVDRPEILQRAQTEWQFAVLSSKLHTVYQQELAELKEKIEALSAYDSTVFGNLRSFWDKVQLQITDRNLYREHVKSLRAISDELFERMKKLRDEKNAEFMQASSGAFEKLSQTMDTIEQRIAEGSAKLGNIFDELKKVQKEYHNSRMSNEHRNQLWTRIDAAFKKAKERRFGGTSEGEFVDRLKTRLSNVEASIKNIEYSLRRDDEELAFQRKRVNTSEGQLEAQIRSAKIKMIEERTSGKRTKLEELKKVQADLHAQIEKAQSREAKAAAKEAERQQVEAKKAAIREEIEAETHAKAEAVHKEDSFFEAASNMLGDVLMDAIDTAKAVASVAAEKAEVVLEQAAEKAGEAAAKAEEILEQVKEKAEEALESFKQEESSDAAKAAGDSVIIDDVVHKAEGDDSGAGLESVKASGDSVIIDDVVHKAESKEAEAPAKPKRTTKKKAE
jgi:Chromosome segregation ATPases